HAWIQKGGWIGVRIPEGRIVVDIDDKTEGALLRELLEGERIHHHSNPATLLYPCVNLFVL
ncbi:hypothetical protein ACUODJ_62110, partial [Escherichia sp. HC-CC]